MVYAAMRSRSQLACFDTNAAFFFFYRDAPVSKGEGDNLLPVPVYFGVLEE